MIIILFAAIWSMYAVDGNIAAIFSGLHFIFIAIYDKIQLIASGKEVLVAMIL